MGHAVFAVVHVAVLVWYPPAILVTLLAHAFVAADQEALEDAHDMGSD